MTNTDAKTNAYSGSDIVAALEDAYRLIQLQHPELPDVVFNTGTGVRGRRARWGHFHHDRWVDALTNGRRPEIFMAGERLACGAEAVLETLLHESAHALAAVRGIKDTSGTGNKYHNKKFLAIAEELTLHYTGEGGHPTFGFSFTDVTDETSVRYADALSALKNATNLYLDNANLTKDGGLIKTPKVKDRNLIKASCDCDPPRIIRASAKVLDGAAITCNDCGYDFIEA